MERLVSSGKGVVVERGTKATGGMLVDEEGPSQRVVRNWIAFARSHGTVPSERAETSQSSLSACPAECNQTPPLQLRRSRSENKAATTSAEERASLQHKRH